MNAGQFFGAMFAPLRRLTDFSGRSTRTELWPFVFLIFVVTQLAMMIAMQGVLADLAITVQQAAQTPNDDFSAAAGPTNIVPSFKAILFVSAGCGLLAVLLLSAVVTRRLHDTNRKGWWALPSAVLLLVGFWLMSRAVSAFGSIDKNGDESHAAAAIFPAFANNFVYIASIVILIVFCVQDGTVGENRFGVDPKKRGANASLPSQPI